MISAILVPPGPNAVEKEEIDKPIKFVVEISEEVKDKEEIYPAEPSPSTVEVILDNAIPPGPNAVEKEEMDKPIKFVVEIIEEVKD